MTRTRNDSSAIGAVRIDSETHKYLSMYSEIKGLKNTQVSRMLVTAFINANKKEIDAEFSKMKQQRQQLSLAAVPAMAPVAPGTVEAPQTAPLPTDDEATRINKLEDEFAAFKEFIFSKMKTAPKK